MQIVQVFRQRWTLDIFHHQIRIVVDRVEIIDLDDIGMPQLGNDTRFPFETLQFI